MPTLIRRNQGQEAAQSGAVWDPFRMMREVLRWDPYRDVESALGAEYRTFMPTFDVKETKDAYVFRADLPGVKDEDLEISLTGNRLTVSGHREEEKREQNETYYATERAYGAFSRTFTLPDGADAEHVGAELKSGVLLLTIPKKPEVQPKKITIAKGGATSPDAKAKA